MTRSVQRLLRYRVIFFRDQNLTREQHIALGAAFGDLEEHPVFSLPDYPQILPLISEEIKRRAARRLSPDQRRQLARRHDLSR